MTELNKIVSKGDLLYIEGRLNYRTKADNQIFTEIVAKNYRILNRKNYSASDKEFEMETDYPIGTIEIEDIDSLNINVFE